MRAYMSDLAARLNCREMGWTKTRPDLVLEAEAVAEAERIVADVEPQCPGFPGIERVRMDRLSHSERAALAEGCARLIVALDEMIAERKV